MTLEEVKKMDIDSICVRELNNLTILCRKVC